jgi:hypothetical protein
MMMMESATPAGFARPRPLSRPRVLRNPRNRHKMIFGKQGKEKDKRDKGDIKDSAGCIQRKNTEPRRNAKEREGTRRNREWTRIRNHRK